MSSFLICLDSKNNVFFADSEASGKIFLKTTEAETVRRVNVTIIGRAHVFFQVHSGGGVTVPFENEEYYLNINECLWEWNESNQLSNGEYWFPFKFRIPSNAPANASEKYGHVQYYVKAEVEYYDKKRFLIKSHTEKEYCGFSVCPIIDLNLRPELKLPAYTFSTQTKRNCFSCATKTLMVSISSPKTGFVCGEAIPLQVDISNKTSMKIKSLEYGILLKCLFSGTHIGTKDITESLNVVNYLVEVKVHTDTISRSGPSASIPIIIGTVPLKKDGKENGDTVSAMEILETADFVEGVPRCKIYDSRRKGPLEFVPKFVYYFNLSSIEKLSSD